MITKKQYIILNIIIFIASLLLALGLFNKEAKKFDKEYHKVKGIITDLFIVPQTENDRYIAFIEYTDSGKINETKAFYDLGDNIHENDSVDIYVVVKNPEITIVENKYIIVFNNIISLPITIYCTLLLMLYLIFRKKLNL